MRGLAQATRLLGAGAGGGGAVRGLLGAGGGASGGPLAMLGAGPGGAMQLRTGADGLARITQLWGQSFPAAASNATASGGRLQAMLNGFRNSLNAPGSGLIASLFTLQNSLRAGAAVFGFGALKGLVDQIGSIGEEASRLGVTNAEFQRLDVLAKQNATSVGALGTAFKTLANNAVDPSKEAAEAFRELDVQVKDGTGAFKSRQDLFFETAGALADIEDKTLRAQMAQKLYGRGALEIAPLLANGRAGLEAQRKELEKLPILNDSLIAKADAFGDSWEIMKVQMMAAAGPVLEGLVIPALQLLADTVGLVSDGVRALTKNLSFGSIAFVAFMFPVSRLIAQMRALVLLGGGWTKVLKAMGGGVKGLVVQFAPLIGAFLILEDVLTFFRGGDSLIGRGLEKAFGPGLKKTVEDLRLAFEDLWGWITGNGQGEKARALYRELVEGIELMVHDLLVNVGVRAGKTGIEGLNDYKAGTTGLGTAGKLLGGVDQSDPFVQRLNEITAARAGGGGTSVVDQSVRSVTVNMLPSSSPDQVASKVGAVLTKDRNAVAAGVP